MQNATQKLLPVMVQLLDKCEDGASVLHEDDSILLHLIIQKYTPETADLLEAESSGWKAFLRVLLLRTSISVGDPPPVISVLNQVRMLYMQKNKRFIH